MTPVILSYGMGVESTAILHRWLTDPTTRDFELAGLTVVTAMTGDEFEDTAGLVTRHVLPLLRAASVRYVQLARKAANVKAAGGDNVVVLADTRSPDVLHLEGCFKLSDEMLAAGTIPTSAGNRLCSLHAKGEVIDAWIARELGGLPFRHAMGFNTDELSRVADDLAAGSRFPGRVPFYPLVRWGWDRDRCQTYLLAAFGEPWMKSCCTQCPFAGGRPEILARYRRFPGKAAEALWMEHLARALNPRMILYGRRSLREVIERDGNAEALRLFEAMLADPALPWAVYRVRRLFRAAGLADRCVEVLAEGTRAEAEAELLRLAALAGVEAGVEDGSLRAWLRRKEAGVAKTAEEMLVACPRVAQEKVGRGWSEERWSAGIALPLTAA